MESRPRPPLHRTPTPHPAPTGTHFCPYPAPLPSRISPPARLSVAQLELTPILDSPSPSEAMQPPPYTRTCPTASPLPPGAAPPAHSQGRGGALLRPSNPPLPRQERLPPYPSPVPVPTPTTQTSPTRPRLTIQTSPPPPPPESRFRSPNSETRHVDLTTQRMSQQFYARRAARRRCPVQAVSPNDTPLESRVADWIVCPRGRVGGADEREERARRAAEVFLGEKERARRFAEWERRRKTEWIRGWIATGGMRVR